MGSTFLSLETARSALIASQVALDVTGQNIANVNNEDYTRQSADLVSVNYSSGVYKFSQTASSNIGQGVTVSRISQIRDVLLDKRVRNANAQYNTYETILSGLSDIEGVIDETDTDGLQAMLNNFYNQLEDLSNNAADVEYSSMVRSAAEKVTQVLNQYASQFSQIRDEQMSSLEISVDEINTTVAKINKLNDLIKDQTVRGSVSNELLDMRNSYLDTLSGYLNITVTSQDDGTVSVTSTGDIDVLDSTFSISSSADQVTIERTDSGGTTEDFSPDNGSVRGYLDILNGAGIYAEGTENTFRGLLYYERALDSFAEAFAGTFNDINTLDPATPANLFTGTTAADISISEEWYDNAQFIVVADQGTNDNVVKMINAMDEEVDQTLYPGVTGTFEGYSRTLMSDIAVDVGYYSDMTDMNKSILDTAANQRESVMGVSVDEETINLTKYQRAYQAAARLMTVLDETLETMINNMGIVGR